MSLAPGTRLGIYEIISPLGAGGMGEVYRARDTRLGRDVALKVLPEAVARDRDRLARFEREAQVLASFNHPNVGAIYGVEDAGGTPALVLELIEGPTLADRIARGAIPFDEALPIARQIAEALEYAHERGVVHRDLKPANVKLDAEGRAKVLDFGLAKAISGDPTTSRSDPSFSPTITSLGTMVGAMIGTAAYMSPEQARGATVDRRADIWAFGAVLFEMLTAARAFEGETVSDTLASVLRAPVEWDRLPTATPRKVVRLLERCLERDAKKRLRDIGEARILLESPGDDAAAAPVSGSNLAPAAPRSRVAALLPWALFLAAVAGLVATFALVPRGAAPAPVVRFEIGADAKLDRMFWPRISPDGKAIAFQGRDASGKVSIWIRPLDAFAAYPLNGTEDAGRPFWSPDSRYVAFFMAKQLMKVPVGGGPAQVICESDTGADGTWGSGGVILFDGANNDPIRRCNASGGVAAEQSKPAPNSGDTQHAWPMFLPDGKHYLLLVMGAGGKQTIHVASLDAPGTKALCPTDSRIEYANGYLLYVLQNTLVARRFDEKRLETIGDPVPLATGVTAQPRANFSASANGVLTFMTAGASASSRLEWVDRSGKDLEAVGSPDDYRDLALSPDGGRLAYGLLSGGAEDIWVRDLKRGVTMRLTSDPKSDIWPVWSHDGARVLFSSDRTGAYAIMAKSSEGTGGEETLAAQPGVNLGAMDWSRDGRVIAMVRIPQGSRPDIAVLPLEGKREPQIVVGEEKVMEFNPRFSPDGKWIAYQSDETGRAEVYVQPYPATGAKWTISSSGGTDPQWRADGKELFFSTPNDAFYAVPMKLGATLEAGIPKMLFTRPLQRSGRIRNRWIVSADGERFLLNAAQERQASAPFSVVLNWPAGLGKE